MKQVKRIASVAAAVFLLWWLMQNRPDFFSGMVSVSLVLLLAFTAAEKTLARMERLALVAVLAAVAAVSRIPFAALPNVQPVTFLVMMSGVVFGRQVGFLTGATAALVSNLFLGQGPWTPWQMMAWGGLGYIAALVAKPFKQKKNALLVLAAIEGFLFGWFMNVWVALAAGSDVFFHTWFLACLASFPMDAAHAASNVLLVTIFYEPVSGLFTRIHRKYDL